MDTRERIESLIDLLMKGNLRPETAARIREWLTESEGREVKDEALEAFFFSAVSEEEPDARAYGMFRRFAVMAGVDDVQASGTAAAARRRASGGGFVRRHTWLAVAAVLLPLFFAAGYLAFKLTDRPSPVNMIEVAVADGEEIPKQIELPDGSQVWMNGSSRIIYPDNFAGGRRVELDGEAFFEVTADTENPFAVMTNNLNVVVTGTEFNLRSFTGGEIAEVRLHSGHVSVKTEDSEFPLAPLQLLTLNVATGGVAVDEFDPSDIDDWRIAEILFDNQPLEKILTRIAKHYKLDIEFAPGAYKDEQVRMVFDKRGDIDDALFVLGYAVQNKFIYVIGDGRICFAAAR